MSNKDHFSAPPIVDREDRKLRFRELIRSPRRSDRFYKATEKETGTELLWMECRRFGELRAFPCAVITGDGEKLCYDPTVNPEAEEKNTRLLRRWAEMKLPERTDDLDIRPLEEGEFRDLYRSLRTGGYME